jgi:hypothetical protein
VLVAVFEVNRSAVDPANASLATPVSWKNGPAQIWCSGYIGRFEVCTCRFNAVMNVL